MLPSDSTSGLALDRCFLDMIKGDLSQPIPDDWRPDDAVETCRCPRPGCSSPGWAVMTDSQVFSLTGVEYQYWEGWCPRHYAWRYSEFDGGPCFPREGNKRFNEDLYYWSLYPLEQVERYLRDGYIMCRHCNNKSLTPYYCYACSRLQ